ncbi:MAG: NADH-quinone oxidoreductase subunit N [Acidobacteriota bacterium]
MIDFSLILPVTILGAYALLLLLLSPLFREGSRIIGFTSLIAIVLSGIATIMIWGPERFTALNMVFIDNFGLFFSLIILAISFLTVMSSISFTEREGIYYGEFYSLILLATAGMIVMIQSRNLLIIFIGLELLSIPLYILAGITRNRLKSLESSLKYFLLGAFSTGFILYGIALIYGVTGSFDLHGISQLPEKGALGLIGVGLIIIGFGFKMAAFPFHFWAPDVYQGAPTIISGFMATGTKTAAFAALLRVLNTSFGEEAVKWVSVLTLLSIITMSFGNLVALAQRNIKRMLAYSSIAHAGYLLIAVVVTGISIDGVNGLSAGVSAIVYYLLAYALMTIGAFAAASLIGRGTEEYEEGYELENYSGLGYRRPLLAAAMSIFLLSLTGIPPTAGFIGKFYVFKAAIEMKLYVLAIVGILNSVIAAYYYLRVIVHMYMKEPALPGEVSKPGFSASVALAIAVLFTFILGTVPGKILYLVSGLFRTL